MTYLFLPDSPRDATEQHVVEYRERVVGTPTVGDKGQTVAYTMELRDRYRNSTYRFELSETQTRLLNNKVPQIPTQSFTAGFSELLRQNADEFLALWESGTPQQQDSVRALLVVWARTGGVYPSVSFKWNDLYRAYRSSESDACHQ